MKLTDAQREALMHVACEANVLRFTRQLSPGIYKAFKKLLAAMGGKWDKKSGTHIFPTDMDVGAEISDVVTTGEYTDAKKEFQAFWTPGDLASRMVMLAKLQPSHHVLEPSAGDGRIAEVIRREVDSLVCVEIQPALVQKLRTRGFEVAEIDFLELEPTAEFDAVIMNPPFCKGQDMRHVRHAWDFLKPGGRLVAITSTGWKFRTDRKSREFCDWLNTTDFDSEYLPDNSFGESGTSVRTVLLQIEKPMEVP